jgi:hypothetical protein
MIGAGRKAIDDEAGGKLEKGGGRAGEEATELVDVASEHFCEPRHPLAFKVTELAPLNMGIHLAAPLMLHGLGEIAPHQARRERHDREGDEHDEGRSRQKPELVRTTGEPQTHQGRGRSFGQDGEHPAQEQQGRHVQHLRENRERRRSEELPTVRSKNLSDGPDG